MQLPPYQWIVSIVAGFIGGLTDGVLRTTNWGEHTGSKVVVTLGYGVGGAMAGFIIYAFNAADSGWDTAAKPGATALALVTGLAGVDYLLRWREKAKTQAANAALVETAENITAAAKEMEPRRRSRRGG